MFDPEQTTGRATTARMAMAVAGSLLAGVAMLLAAPSISRAGGSARPALGTVYGGSTPERHAVVLTLTKRGKLDGLAVDMRTTCDNGKTFTYSRQARFADKLPHIPALTTLTFAGRGISRTGRFHASGIGNDQTTDGDSVGVVATVKGRVTRGSASGTLSVQLVGVDPATGAERFQCDFGDVAWRATSARGRVFGGRSAQGFPLVVELVPGGAKVRSFLTRYGARCTPSNDSVEGSTAGPTGFPVTAGAFDHTTSSHFDEGGGLTRDISLTFAGKVAARSASGTFELTGKDSDATGAVVDTCATGPVTWSAASS